MNSRFQCFVKDLNSVCREEENTAVVFQHAEEDCKENVSVGYTERFPRRKDLHERTRHKFIPLEPVNCALLNENLGLV